MHLLNTNNDKACNIIDVPIYTSVNLGHIMITYDTAWTAIVYYGLYFITFDQTHE